MRDITAMHARPFPRLLAEHLTGLFGHARFAGPLVFLFCVAMVAGGCQQQAGSRTGGDSAEGMGAIRGVFLVGPERPAHGTAVYLEGHDRLARTDEQGAFLLTAVPPGRHVVLAERAGYEPLRARAVDVVAGKTTDIGSAIMQVAIEDEDESMSAEVFGYAFRFGQLSHEGIVVRVEDRPTLRTTTDPDGGFFLERMPTGQVTLVFLAPNHAEETRTIILGPGLTVVPEPDAPILMPHNAQPLVAAAAAMQAAEAAPVIPLEAAEGDEGVYGRVEVPVPAEILPRLMESATAILATSDADDAQQLHTSVRADGSFRFRPVVPGDYRLRLNTPMLEIDADAALDVRVEPRRNVVLTISAAPAVDVSGWLAELAAAREAAVVRPAAATAGDPEATAPPETGSIAGEAVAPASGNASPVFPTVALLGTPHSVVTGTDGSFAFADLAPGRYRLVVQATGYLPHGPVVVEVAAGQETRLERVVLEPDVLRPEVVRTTPRNAARDIRVDESMTVSLEFNTEMNMGTVRRALRISPEVEWRMVTDANASSRLVTLELRGAGSPAMAFRTRHVVTLAATAQSRDGVTMAEPFSFAFTTAGPELIDSYPKDRDSTVFPNIDNPLVLYFNAPLDKPRDLERLVRIRPDEGGATPRVQMFNDNRTGWGVIEVFFPFQPQKRYIVRVDSRLRTASGDRVSNLPRTINFTVPEVVLEGSMDAFRNQRPRGREGSRYRPEVATPQSSGNPYEQRRR